MKMFIVKEEKEYKIMRVENDQVNIFKEEYGKRIVVEADNLGDLINNFQPLDLPKMRINPEISSCHLAKVKQEEETFINQKRQRM